MKMRRCEENENRYLEFRDLHGQTLAEELAEMVKETQNKKPRFKLDWKWKHGGKQHE